MFLVNVDIVNLEVLKFVRYVDVFGRRMIGVFIKVDLMDYGINVFDIFFGCVYFLKLGWIGVVNWL